MPTRVQLPDGSIGEFPDGMSEEQISGVLAKQFPPPLPPQVGTGLGVDPHAMPHTLGQAGHEVAKAFSNVGSGGLGLLSGIGRATFALPLDVANNRPTIYEEGYNALKHPWDTLQSMGKAAQEHPLETLEQGIGAAGAIPAVSGLGRGITPYRSPVVPTAETSAENLVKAILPQEGVTPGNVKSVMQEAPALRHYAAKTGNPLKTIPEGRIAAEGVANEGLQHYRQNFLEPNANVSMSLENNMSPELGGQATLGQIEKRISDINDLTRGAMRTAKSGGAEMTAMERQGFENEGKALRAKLYQGLSEKTGVSPDDIQGLREGYGGQFAIKNALDSGHYGRLTRSGMESQGGSLPTSKTGLLEQVFRRGPFSQEAIANRQFAKRIRAFDPQEPNYPVPNPPRMTPFQGAPVGPEVAQRIGAMGTPQNAGVFRPAPEPVRPLQGPMAKAPAVIEAERVAKAFQEETTAANEAKKAARRSTAGKRLQGEQ